MVHIWQDIGWDEGVIRSIGFVKDSLPKLNKEPKRESLDGDWYNIEVQGRHGRRLCCLAFDIFNKDSVIFPNLEVLAYGEFTGDWMDEDGVLIVRDPHRPSGCSIVPASELEAHTTVKSPMSFLRAFTTRPTTFWAH